ncbi:MAG: amidohydrolase [Saprospiraceae bacterium]|nr:amidohydrolase [Saprospiraceae bacterium]
MKEQVQALAQQYHEEVIQLRRHIHQHPELSFHEVETGKFIAGKLKDWGIPFEHGVADNGVVGLIEGKKGKGRVVALRADIDALPITEANDVPYKSKNDGVMHACGHDVHSSSLLGTAKILNELKDQITGTIKLIFQPAEEMLPGGASIMIKEGVLENPAPASIFGQHVHPPLQVGKVGFRPGMYMASTDELYMTVTGKGGHGAIPQNCIDPIVITSQIITALQQVVSRRANPTMPSVLTFGYIASTGGSTNVIPNEVKLKGTFRTYDEDWRYEAHRIMKEVAEGMAKAMGGACELQVANGYPALINNPDLTRNAKAYAVEYLGSDNVVDLPMRMTGEDFAYYSQVMPACFYRLGTGNPAKGINSPIHTNTFNVDEHCLQVSTGLMAWMTLQELNRTS